MNKSLNRHTSNLSVLTALLFALLIVVPFPAANSEEPPTVMITGSNRGIGLEFVRQYAEAGWLVIATCRTPDSANDLNELAKQYANISIEQLDITDPEQIAALAGKRAGQPVKVLINNAALLGPRNVQVFEGQDYALAEQQFRVNALGPMRVSEAFIDNVRAGGPGKIISLGSAAGSNGYLRPPADFYSYRASKAALHFYMHNLALELADEAIVVGLINPGMVDTRGLAQLGPDDPVPEDFRQIVKLIRAGSIELSTPQESVTAMRELISSLSMEQSGMFLNFDGQPMPW
jgi:NAD(P)-dependent dehydrogenase (short-subunit alcohol dehydrogenase family)